MGNTETEGGMMGKRGSSKEGERLRIGKLFMAGQLKDRIQNRRHNFVVWLK